MRPNFLYLLLAALPLLAGCAEQYPLNARLEPEIAAQPGALYTAGESAVITSRDSRPEREIIFYRLEGKDPVAIANLTPPHLLLAEKLADGLRGQGLALGANAPLTMLVDLRELRTTVTREKMIYNTTTRCSLEISLAEGGRTLGKKFNLESNRESLGKPEVDELEKTLSAQLADAIEQILSDDGIRRFIREQQGA